MNKPQFSLSIVLGLILSVAFIWVFVFSIWYSNNIINEDKFVSTTTQVLDSESVRESISTEIINRVKIKRPILGTLAAPLLEKVIAGVLNSDLYSTANTKIAQEIHLQLTSANPRELALDLAPTKQFLSPFIDRMDPQLLRDIPDKIVVLRKNEIPSLYKFGTYLTILGPILLIAALIILSLIWRKIIDKRSYITVLSLIFAASGLLVYFIVPAAGSYLTAQASSINVASIISEIYVAFTAPISNFALNLMIAGLIVALAAKFLKRELFRLPQKNNTPRAK